MPPKHKTLHNQLLRRKRRQERGVTNQSHIAPHLRGYNLSQVFERLNAKAGLNDGSVSDFPMPHTHVSIWQKIKEFLTLAVKRIW